MDILITLEVSDVLRFETELFRFVEGSSVFSPIVDNLQTDLNESALKTLLNFFSKVVFKKKQLFN